MNITSTTRSKANVLPKATTHKQSEDKSDSGKDSFSFVDSYANQSRKTASGLIALSPAIGGGFAGYKIGRSFGGEIGGVIGLATGALGGTAVAVKAGLDKVADNLTSTLDAKLSSGQEALVYGALEAGLATALGGLGFGVGTVLGNTALVGLDYLDHRGEQSKAKKSAS